MKICRNIFLTIWAINFILIRYCATQSVRRQMQLVLLTDAPAKHGAMCLDGSPPGFYYRPGFGNDRSKWIVHLQGGGWCLSETDCATRSLTTLGSSKLLSKTLIFTRTGILSSVQRFNPDFYNWNVVYVNYCDGGSFTGYRQDPVLIGNRTIYFRGLQIREAVFEALLAMGMDRATDIILTGCSAGGVSAFIHADYIQSLLSPSVKYVAMADAGILSDTPNFRLFFVTVSNVHNSSGGLDVDCVQEYKDKNEEWRCFLAQYAVPHVTTSMFFYNSIYDTFSLAVNGPLSCLTPSTCQNIEEILPKMHEEFFNTTVEIESRQGFGIYFDSCLRHCQSVDDSWYRSVRVDGLLAREVFANWYFNRSEITKVVDCTYPCNESCGHPRDAYGNISPV